MSPLTKLFVVLLVVLSLLMTAGTVVYVTRDSKAVADLETVNIKLAGAENAAAQSSSALQASQTNLAAAQGALSRQAEASATALSTALNQINDLNVQLAKASANGATQELQIARLAEGLQAAQNTAAQLNTTVAQLRQNGDELIRRATDDSSAISDLTNRLEVTERERRNLAEQLAEATQSGGGAAPAARGPVAAPDIQGVIRDRRKIGGKEYATISVGTVDSVARGMEFKVLNRGNFLGTLTVDAVEANEATGILTGPNVKDIVKGVEVRTQY